VLREKDRPQRYDDAYVQQSRSADEHEDKKHGVRYLCEIKRSSTCGIHHPNRTETPKFCDQIDVQHVVENHKISKKHQIYV
jgi:hypothetical protein